MTVIDNQNALQACNNVYHKGSPVDASDKVKRVFKKEIAVFLYIN